MTRLIREKYPKLYKTKEEGGKEDYGDLLDFRGLGCALAFGQGFAGGMHLDPGDSIYTHAVIFSAGTGVIFFCIPQLNLRIPLFPGQMLSFPARLLSHYAYLIESTGERVLFNFFTDDTSIAKATREYHLDHLNNVVP